MRSFATFLPLLAFIALLTAPPAHTQTPGSCTVGTDEADLNQSDVLARVFNTGTLFFGNTTTNGDGYLVPQSSGHSPLFAAGIWVAGEVDGMLYAAGSTYSDFEFWPGPLDDGGALPNPSDCSDYDRIWVVSALDVEAYEQTGQATPDLAAWPVGLGAEAVDANGDPVVPTSREQVIDLEAGERPVIFGSQTAFWVMNDVGGEHLRTGTLPIGLEVQVTAFSIASTEAAADQATFYRYRLVNRGPHLLEDTRFSFFADPDLGDPLDDYVGSDSARGMAFVYNGDNNDAVYGVPPAVGFDLLDGAGGAMYFSNEASPTGDPDTGGEMYNFMQGRWGDGTVMREGGDGYNSPGPITVWAYAGDPVTAQFWSERNIDGAGTTNPAGDRRLLVSSEAFTLASGEVRDFTLALVFAQGSNNLDSITELRAADDLIQAAYDDGSLFETTGSPDVLPTPELLSPPEGTLIVGEEPVLTWTPVEGATFYTVRWSTGFSTVESETSPTSAFAIPSERLPRDLLVTVNWSVRAEAPNAQSPYSETRSFEYYYYVGGPLLIDPAEDPNDLSNLAFVELTAPGGDPACEPGDTSNGCAQVGGDGIYQSYNSTNQYIGYHGSNEGSEATIGAFAPSDYEIRFTDEGSWAVHAFSTERVVHVPFEVWDLGVVAPFEENDPSDDRQMVAAINSTAGTDEASECTFDFGDGETIFGIGEVTDWIYAYYPTTTYAEFEAAAIASAGGTDCSGPDSPASDLIYLDIGRPLQRFLMEDTGIGSVAAMEGTVIRFYTSDPLVVAAEPGGPGTEQPSGYALGAAYPNPFGARTTLPYAVATASRVRLSVYDVLGREVAVLADGPVEAGRHEAMLEGRGLASGVYVVVLEVEGARRATRKVLLVR